jgi:hypothetical protein
MKRQGSTTSAWIAALLLAGLLASCGCGSAGVARGEGESLPVADVAPEAPAPEPPKPAPKPEQKPDLELLEFSGETNAYGGKIVGKVRNNSGKRYDYAQVVFTLMNDAGEQTGSAMANVNGLEPGRVWAFEAVAFGQFTQMKLDKITGF